MCSSDCHLQVHCGWCVASGRCSAQVICSQEAIFLDECLEISLSPSIFDPSFGETVTISVAPSLPEFLYSTKRATLATNDLYCELSTGDSIAAVVTSNWTLTCDLPKVSSTNQPVTLTVKYLNSTLIAPTTLETFDCAAYNTCDQCVYVQESFAIFVDVVL